MHNTTFPWYLSFSAYDGVVFQHIILCINCNNFVDTTLLQMGTTSLYAGISLPIVVSMGTVDLLFTSDAQQITVQVQFMIYF